MAEVLLNRCGRWTSRSGGDVWMCGLEQERDDAATGSAAATGRCRRFNRHAYGGWFRCCAVCCHRSRCSQHVVVDLAPPPRRDADSTAPIESIDAHCRRLLGGCRNLRRLGSIESDSSRSVRCCSGTAHGVGRRVDCASERSPAAGRAGGRTQSIVPTTSRQARRSWCSDRRS